MMALPKFPASTSTIPSMEDFDIRTLATDGGLPVVDTPTHSIRSNSISGDEVTESNSEMESKSIESGYDVESKSSSPVKLEQKALRKHDPINIPPSFPSNLTEKLNPVQLVEEQLNLPLRPGAEECLFYIHTGWCGYGSACRYNHPQEKMVMYKPKAFNDQGLPLRDNVADCSFYMRTGGCKFGATCKFNHPQSVLNSTTGASQANGAAPAVVVPNHVHHHTPSAADSVPVSAQSFVYQVPYPIAAPSPIHGGSPSSPRSKSVSSNLSYLHPTTASPLGLVPANPMTAHHHIPATGYFVYYVPATTTIMNQEQCWSHLNTGRCDLGSQCPYLH